MGLAMAALAAAEMGEIDEVHSKEEDITVNGELSDDNDEEQKGIDKENEGTENFSAPEDEKMDVDDVVDEKEPSSNENAKELTNADDSLDENIDETKTLSDNQDDKDNISEESVNNDDNEVNDSVDKNKNNSEKVLDDVDIHEIEDDEQQKPDNTNHETIELNDSGGEADEDDDDDGDVIVVETPTKNGTDEKTKDEIINLETPEKKTTEKKQKNLQLTPRRSSRNLNKSKSYVENNKELVERSVERHSSGESDVEEVLPEDPLAVAGDSMTIERIDKSKSNQSTIVVKDTKRLVEIASKTSNSNSGKKEPTLVIIDTNSILSGRGPVPLNNKSSLGSSSNYQTVLPMALPAQGMYPPNMRATITPIPLNPSQMNSKSSSSSSSSPVVAASTPLLPTLTDDMFVVEAPSFIVPYVYEKPPVKDFKDFLKEFKNSLQDTKKTNKKKEQSSEDGGSGGGGGGGSVNSDKEDETMDVDDSDEQMSNEDTEKPYSYFESPLGKFFTDIGLNLVQEFVQNDLLKQTKRKRDREGGQNPETDRTIQSLTKNLEFMKGTNEHYKMILKKCEFCSFKTESSLALAYHLETPHMKNFVYRCNFCSYEVRSPHDILFHTEAEHAVKAHLERAPAFHQCPSCPFEDNQKGKLSRHLVGCARKFKPEKNLEPPFDWEPPAKIPRVPKMRQQGLNATAAAYQALSKASQYQFLSKIQLQNSQQAMQRGRGRPSLGSNGKPQQILRPSGMVFKQHNMSGGSVLVPTNYQLSGNQVFQVVGGQDLSGRLGNTGPMAFVPNIPSASSTINIQNQNKKPVHQPSISITPLPRASSTSSSVVSTKPGDSNSKNSFVICEICDGYIKDLEQLRNHMQWIHKIKIHPKMIYNRPPLNCQKCQFRFFTDQGLERHLLGSHGLVTSSMQDAANKSKDSGRCPVCGRVYQWKLLNHVARDHNMTLKPAHLSYKCTVCTATFGMYKQFENHVYSAHSVVAKRVMDKKSSSSTSSSSKNDQMKPLKINDEITIIPQPAKSTNGAKDDSSTGSRNSTPSTSKNADSSPPCTSRAERLARRNAIGDD